MGRSEQDLPICLRVSTVAPEREFAMTRLDLCVVPAARPLFNPLLEKGVVVAARTGGSLREFLCSQLGLTDRYLDERIQTLFLNARPVDDVDTAIVRDGSTLALSAAMPGLLGATMRKGGRYAAFRKSISQADDACGTGQASGHVTVKLFNLVAREIGGHLLSMGVTVAGSDLLRIVDGYPRGLQHLLGATLDGRPAPVDRALFFGLANRPVVLTVRERAPQQEPA